MTLLSAISIPRSSEVRPLSFGERAKRPPRVGVIYPSGWGNLGDEAIMQATFQALREQWPDVAIRAFTLHPERTAANHQVDTEFLTGVNLRMFLSPRGDGPLPIRIAKAVARRTRKIPFIGRIFSASADFTAAVLLESISLRSAWRWLQSADLLLAAGGGQLDAVWGGTWGQPYALARWAWLAKRAGVPFAFLSVGYGAARTRTSRAFLRYAISAADYCSLRDAGSRDLTKQLGVRTELPVFPDLAFRLKSRPPLVARRPGFDVAMSPMAYMRPGSWPDENGEEYQRYLNLWAEVTAERVRQGDRVHFFVTDPTDTVAVHEVWDRLDDATRERCSIAEPMSPSELLEFYRSVDVVISSRLHGVLLAIVAARPVVGLSHERKVRALMTEAGVGAFCLDLPTTSVRDVSSHFMNLTQQLEGCTRSLRDFAKRSRTSVKRQEAILPALMRSR